MITNLDGRVDNWQVRLVPLSIRTDSGEEFEYSVQPTFERLVEPFEISDGVIIPAGSYRWTEHEVEASTASKVAASWRSIQVGELLWRNTASDIVRVDLKAQRTFLAARPNGKGARVASLGRLRHAAFFRRVGLRSFARRHMVEPDPV